MMINYRELVVTEHLLIVTLSEELSRHNAI